MSRSVAVPGRHFAPVPARRRLRQAVAATAVSSLGDGLVLVAFPLIALRVTANPVAIAGVTVAGQLPSLLCALPAGALVDRVNRRRLAGLVNVARAGILGCFALLVALLGIHLWAIYGAIALLGTFQIVFVALSQVTLPALIPRSALARANGQLMAAEIASEQAAGPAIGGVLYGIAKTIPFIGDAISFLASGVLLQWAIPDTAPPPAKRPWRSDIGEGLRWFFGEPALRLAALLMGGVAFFQAMVIALLALFAVNDLGLGHVGYGVLVATIAIGNIIGALGASRVLSLLGPATTLVLSVLMAAGSYLILSVSHSPVAAAAALSLETVGVSVCNVASISIRQWIVPDHLLGRVTTVFRMIILGLIPFGALAGGITADNIGIRPTFLLAGSVALGIVVFLGPVTWRQVARLRLSPS